MDVTVVVDAVVLVLVGTVYVTVLHAEVVVPEIVKTAAVSTLTA